MIRLSNDGLVPFRGTSFNCVALVSVYLNSSSMHALIQTCSGISKAILETLEQRKETREFSLIFRVLKSSLADGRILSFIEYRFCNAKLHPVAFKFTKEGIKVPLYDVNTMELEAYKRYKQQKFLKEQAGLAQTFKSVTQFDWRKGCCKDGDTHRSTAEIQTVKGPIRLYWKALKGIIKFQKIERLMLTTYPKGKPVHYAFRGESLGAFLKDAVMACAEQHHQKFEAFEAENGCKNALDGLIRRMKDSDKDLEDLEEMKMCMDHFKKSKKS